MVRQVLTAEAPSLAPGIETRAIEAMLTCVARHGLSKTTLDDVAREAGCARASLYRYFGGKQELVRATVRSEAERLLGAVARAALEHDDFEDAAVAMVVTAARELDRQPALQFVLANELDLVLPRLTFDAGSRFLATTGDAIAPLLTRFFAGDDVPRAAEWLARVVFAFAVVPTSPTDLRDEATTRVFLREFVLPGLLALQTVRPPTRLTRG